MFLYFNLITLYSRSGPSLGRLHLRLQYDFDRSDLNVHLIEAHDLAGSDQGGFNDPYVKLTLSPEVDARKRQTSIFRDNPNPFFDEHFKFPVSYEELQEKILVLQVTDHFVISLIRLLDYHDTTRYLQLFHLTAIKV